MRYISLVYAGRSFTACNPRSHGLVDLGVRRPKDCLFKDVGPKVTPAIIIVQGNILNDIVEKAFIKEKGVWLLYMAASNWQKLHHKKKFSYAIGPKYNPSSNGTQIVP